MENNEKVATVVNQSLNLLRNYKPNGSDVNNAGRTGNDVSNLNESPKQNFYRAEIVYKKLSFVYADRAYVVARSGNKIYVVQKLKPEAPSIGIPILG